MKPAWAALGAAVLLAACATGPATPRVRVATTSGIQSFSLSLHLAQSLGYFRDANIEVTIEPLASAGKALQALVGGSAEVGTVAYGQLLQLAAEQQHLRSFFVLTRRGNISIVVAPRTAARIRRPEDLNGALIGVSSPGSPTHQLVNYYLAAHGVPTSAFRTVGIGMGPPALAAIEQGQLDAAAVASGEILLLRQRHPGLRVLIDTSTAEGMREIYGADYYASGVLAARPEWLNGNREAARRLARALARTHAWIAAHNAEQILEKIPAALRSATDALDADIVRWAVSVYTVDGRMLNGAPGIMLRYARQTVPEIREKPVDLPSTWTDEFLD